MSSFDPAVCIIVAASENNVIGKNGSLPWHISGDLKYVKARTWGKPIIMGRKTYEDLGKPLPGRDNIVVTRKNLDDKGVIVKSDLESAIQEGKTRALMDQSDEVFIFGGGQIYEQALPLASRIYLTRVHLTIENGDTFFPSLDPNIWKQIDRKDVENDQDPPHSYLILERENS